MNIKSSHKLVEEAEKKIETLSAEKAKELEQRFNQSIINNFYQNEKVRREYKNQVKKIEENNVDVFQAYQKIILSQES